MAVAANDLTIREGLRLTISPDLLNLHADGQGNKSKLFEVLKRALTGQMCFRVRIKDGLTSYTDSWSLESTAGCLQKAA